MREGWEVVEVAGVGVAHAKFGRRGATGQPERRLVVADFRLEFFGLGFDRVHVRLGYGAVEGFAGHLAGEFIEPHLGGMCCHLFFSSNSLKTCASSLRQPGFTMSSCAAMSAHAVLNCFAFHSGLPMMRSSLFS